MVSLNHIRLFLEQFPGSVPDPTTSLAQAREATIGKPNGLLVSAQVEEILGQPAAKILFRIMNERPEYLAISQRLTEVM